MSHSFSIPEQQALVAQWRASGLTMTQFAKQHELYLSTLYRWQAKYAALTFARVELVEPPPSSPTLIVELAYTGHRVHVPPGFDAAELRRLMEALC